MTHEAIVVLAGGVGAARFLRGLARVVDPERITVIGNTGDDRRFYGVHVSPDVDIVTYTLAGIVDAEKGYGLEGDTFTLVDRLAELGHEAWFRLGDRDFANCLHRTLRLRAGAGLAEVTDELRRNLEVATRVLPMSEDPCPTMVRLDDDRWLHFEEYMVRERAPDTVREVDLSAAEHARAGPGVLDAIATASTIVVCPSNPVVSIGPILAVPGVRDAVAAAAAPVVAISPIVGNAPIKGPADRLLRGTGVEVSARGVAGLYREWVDAMVIDERDAAQLADVEAMDLRVTAVDSLMVNPDVAAKLARAALDLVAA